MPDSYYKFCEESQCAEQVVRTFSKYFPKGKIEFRNYNRPDPSYEQITFRTRTEPTHWNGNKRNVELHYKLIRDVEAGNPPASAGAAQ